MKILAMDTATMVSSVAVATKERVLAELTAETRFTHSETLVPNIEEVLRLADVQREELSAVAVSLGPGSFTGLRIGLAAAKAIAYALNIPLVGVPTPEVLAAAFSSPGALIAPLIDAQKGNAYFSLYRFTENGLVCERGVTVASPQEIAAAISEEKSPVVLAGDFARKWVARGAELPANAMLAPITHCMPRAALVAACAIARLQNGEGKSSMELEPIYVRRSEAEVLWEKRHREETP
ncbi:MAG: tRNA (adenosine(37)-N6)-threonylcarbamoyltransferase complex dimerization subunit type 1 TsaB [Schwartzia sp.]|nr:tRNA (adenosine(37)-N6)-threonylcarbamoyltransferase complex dimerization subunit type 1 TsaB [Schwartzia sp. (in: firmicutes)]